MLDDRFPPNDLRHIVLEAHCFLLEDEKTVGASGKIDPKELLIGNILYIREKDSCELCERDDFIPKKRRFRDSKYRPSRAQIWWKRFRAIIGRMKTKADEVSKTEFGNFTKTMKALFKVPKSAVVEKPKPKKKRD